MCWQELVKSGAQDVQAGALETIGNLAFCRANRYLIMHTPTLMQRLGQIAHSSLGTTTTLGRHAACRALAILGEIGCCAVYCGVRACGCRSVAPLHAT